MLRITAGVGVPASPVRRGRVACRLMDATAIGHPVRVERTGTTRGVRSTEQKAFANADGVQNRRRPIFVSSIENVTADAIRSSVTKPAIVDETQLVDIVVGLVTNRVVNAERADVITMD